MIKLFQLKNLRRPTIFLYQTQFRMEGTQNNMGPVETSINQKLNQMFNPHHL